MVNRHLEGNMAHNLPKTRGRGADYEPYFLERALASLLRLTKNYPMTQLPFTWPFLIALAELRCMA
jgi:hypothetical protein